MNLVKKFAYTSMALLLALGISACGNNEKVEEEKKTETTEPANKEETKEEGKEEKKEEGKKEASKDGVPTITYLNIGTPQAGTEETVAKINEYLDEKDAGYHLNLVFYDWGDYEQRLQLASSTGEDWDLAFTASWAGPYKTLVSKNALMDLTDLMKGKEFVDLINPDMIKGASVDGKVYGIPAAYPGVVAANQFVWTKSWVDKYNIDYKNIQDIKELEPILKDIKEKEGMEYPFGVSKDFLFAMPKPVYQVTDGVAVREEDGKLKAFIRKRDPDGCAGCQGDSFKGAGVHHDGGEQYCIDKGIPVPDAWMEIWRIGRNLCITGPAGTDECIDQSRRGHCESTGK